MQRLPALSSVLVLLLSVGCDGRQPIAGADAGTGDGFAVPRVDAWRVPPPPDDPCRRWTCTGSQIGATCRADFSTLPPINASPWRCHQARGAWHCDARSPMGGIPTPPPPACSEGWTCEQIAVEGSSPDGTLPYPGYDSIYRCSRVVDDRDTPPGLQHAVACVRGAAFGGTRCEIVAQASGPSGPLPPVGGGCQPGEKRWCEDQQYGGWGAVTCRPEGRWPTVVVNGRQILDCQGYSDGRRPDTLCACYHPYVNFACCERVDCKVVTRDDGSTSEQTCGQSNGKLCDRCNPQNSKCAAAGSSCLVFNTGEAFCSADCSGGQSCPDGYECHSVKKSGAQIEQCVPADLSCYY